MSSTPDDGYIKLWRKALHNGSSLMKLTATQRWVFLAYATAARWQEPYRGALCDEDGTPWSRTKRAEIAGVRYETAKAAEEEMIELDMAVLDGRGATDNPQSIGRFHIKNYADYQANNRPPKPEDDEVRPPKPEDGKNGSPSETGGVRPPKPEDDSFDNSPSETGGRDDGKPVTDGDESQPTLDMTPSETGGQDSQEGSKKVKGSNEGASAKNTDADTLQKATHERLQETGLRGRFAKGLIRQFIDETDYQIVIRELWEACGFEGAPGGHGYSGLVKLCQEFGFPKLQRLASHFRRSDLQPPPGADQWAWFSKTVRRKLNRDFKWDEQQEQKQGRRSTQVASKEEIENIKLDENGRYRGD